MHLVFIKSDRSKTRQQTVLRDEKPLVTAEQPPPSPCPPRVFDLHLVINTVEDDHEVVDPKRVDLHSFAVTQTEHASITVSHCQRARLRDVIVILKH